MKRTHLKMKIRSGFFVIPLMIIAVFVSSCADEKVPTSVYDPSKPLVCEQFLPDSGGVGTKLIIVGENFGSDTSLVKVFVNNKFARVIGVNDTRIYAVVPSRADTGFVKVVLGRNDSTQTFTFDRKFIYQFRQNVSTLCGQTTDAGTGDVKDGSLTDAWLNTPVWLALDNDNTLYVVEEFKGIRMVSPSENKVTTPYRIGGSIGRPRTVAFSLTQDTMYLTNDQWGDTGTGTAMLLRNTGFMSPRVIINSKTTNAAICNPVTGDLIYNRYADGMVYRYDKKTAKSIELNRVDESDMELSFAFTNDGKTLYIICRNRHYIMRADYNLETKQLENLERFCGLKNTSGNQEGLGTEARLNQPCEGACDKEGNLYVADCNNHCIRKITPDGMMTTFAGVAGQEGYIDGEPMASKFRNPEGLAIDKNGVVYVADKNNHRIRKILIE